MSYPARRLTTDEMTKRNEPCPCGSGKKYKKCHLRIEGAGSPEAVTGEQNGPGWGGLDQALTMRVIEFGKRHFPIELREWALFGFGSGDDPIYNQFVIPWLAWGVWYDDGRRLGEHFLDREGSRLSPREREFAAAQLRGWVSVWEVEDVVAGESLDLVDLLSGERRHVREASGSREARPGMAFLARIVDFEGISLICGMHPRILLPLDAATVLRELKRFLGTRRKSVPLEMLRHPDTAAEILEIWESVVDESEARFENLSIQNRDGDPLLFTTDRARLSRSGRSRVESHLRTSPDVREAKLDDGMVEWVIVDEANSLLGRLTFETESLRVETNSVRRADTLRERIEDALGDADVRWIRDHSDPTSTAVTEEYASEASAAEPPEAAGIVLQMKRSHYEAWVDEKIPALGGRTPREAMKTRKGREEVERMIRQIDYIEAGFPEDRRYDTAEIRKTLGLKPKRN